MRAGRRLAILLVLAFAAASVPAALAQGRPPLYLQFDPYTVKGALYRPDGDEPAVGVLLIHRVNNYLGHLAASELARRGFLVLAMNSRFDNNEAAVLWEHIALDVKTGVEFLRRQGGVRSRPRALQIAVGINSRAGNRSVGPPPAVSGRRMPGGRSVQPHVNLSSTTRAGVRAGPHEPPHRRGGRPGQQSRERARAPFPDDNVFLIVRGQGARLADADTLAETATASPRKLLRNNGSTVTQIVKSVRPAVRPNPAPNATFDGGARLLTLKSFLTANAIRSTHSMTGVEWCSSNNSTPCALGQIGVPLLVSAMGGNTGLRDNEWLYETAASRDKDFFVLEGATHNIDPCVECETRKGEYGNSVKNFFNYVRDWMNVRFSR